MSPTVLCFALCALWSGIASAQDILAIRSATLVDAGAGQAREHTTIIIRGEVIVAVGPDDRHKFPGVDSERGVPHGTQVAVRDAELIDLKHAALTRPIAPRGRP